MKQEEEKKIATLTRDGKHKILDDSFNEEEEDDDGNNKVYDVMRLVQLHNIILIYFHLFVNLFLEHTKSYL